MARPWAVVAGGGTAGHLLPGLAVAEELVARGHDPSTICFVGSRHGIEAELLAATEFPVVLLPGRGVERRISISSMAAVASLLAAAVRAFGLLLRRRPRVVLVLGGYASVACAVAAVALRIPLVVAEQNARAGMANRLVGRFARACAVAFEETDLPHAVLTGNPVRTELLAVQRSSDAEPARRALGVPDGRVLVAVVTGSLGSARVNAAAREAVTLLAGRGDLAVHHVIGSRDWSAIEDDPLNLTAGRVHYQAVRYEDQMERLLAAADLVVSRAGGTTVAELAALGIPSILVPLPIAPRDHQRANARALVASGAAVLVEDAELDGPGLADLLQGFLDTPERLAAMADAAGHLGRRDAAQAVASLVEEHAA